MQSIRRLAAPHALVPALLTALMMLSGCQYSGSFDGKRCSKQSDCAGAAQCVEGYCVSTDVSFTDTPSTLVSAVEMTPESLEMVPGDQRQLQASPLDGEGGVVANAELEWTSSDEQVATVTGEGLVEALAPGTTIIAAAAGNSFDTATITVSGIAAGSVTVDPQALELKPGQTGALTATVFDANDEELPERTVSWSSSAPTIAVVDQNGEVTAISPGSAEITATSGSVAASATVTVASPDITSVELTPGTLELTIEDTFSLAATVRDENGDIVEDATIDWSSDDATIASVDANGTVTAVAAGTANITAAVGQAQATAEITVVPPAVASIELSPRSASMEVNQTVDLTATARAGDGTELTWPTITFSSSDDTIATVDANGTVTGVLPGTVAITAEADGVERSAAITVNPSQYTALSVSPSTSSIEVGQTVDLDATAQDGTGSTINNAPVTWTSSDTSVAVVDADGVVLAVGNTPQSTTDTVTITATGANGTQATATVDVSRRSAATIDLEPQAASIEATQTLALDATVKASDDTILAGRTITYTSSNENLATVDANGVVTGVSQGGPVTITATSGTATGTVDITVTERTVATVEVSPQLDTVEEGSTISLSATPKAIDGAALTGRTTTWSSDDDTIATVDTQGVVTGQNPGFVIIRATVQGKVGIAAVDVTSSAAPNRAPSATADSLTTDEDTPLVLTLAGTDPDGDALSFSLTTLPKDGTLTGLDTATGDVTYTPDADFNGSDSFTFTVTDGSGASGSATISLTINAVNDAPMAADDADTTTEETPVTVDVLANDADIENDSLTVAIDSQPSNGSVSVNGDQTITYTPDADFAGADSFTYTASDGALSDTGTVRIDVSSANDGPSASDDSATTDEDMSVTFSVLANDSDPEGDPLTVTATGTPANGTVANNGDGTLTYTPNTDYNGADSFTYTVSDGNQTATATVNVTVNAVNDAPVASGDTATTDEDTSVSIDVLANDVDVDSMALTLVSVDLPAAYGTATVNTGTNMIDYTPDADFSGTDFFTYTVSDGDTTSSVWVQVTVNPANDAPVANTDAVTSDEDSPITFDVLGNDSDIDGDTLSVTATTSPANGTVVDNGDGTLTYTPDADFNGSDSFTYDISDGNGENATGTVNVTIDAVNDLPVADAGANQYGVGHDTVVNLDASASSDVETAAAGLSYSWTFIQNPDGATLNNPNTATPDFTTGPEAGGSNNAAYNYELEVTVTDADGGTDTARVVVTTDDN